MSGFTGSFEEQPPGENPFGRGFQASCPGCGTNISFEILLDLYKTTCPSCGKYAILYFWGKESGPHLTEDLAYMFLEEGFLSEENLENALETKKQSAPMPFVEFLLSIQYVTVSELEELARRLIPDDWRRELSGESFRQPPRPEQQDEPDRLARPDVDAVYALIDQIISGCGHPFSRMRAVDLERLIRSLGGDLVAGAIRTRFGRMILDPDLFSTETTDASFARSFSDAFELEYTETTSSDTTGEPELNQDPAFFRQNTILPLSCEEDILHVGIAGHYLALGFSVIDLVPPKSIRDRLNRPVSFSIMPLEQIQAGLSARFDLELPMDPGEVNELLGTVAGELSDELIHRYRSLNPEEQPVSPGHETERPSVVLRAIFKSFSLDQMEDEPPSVSEETDAIQSWLYHDEAANVIPPYLNRDRLDELLIWGENQVLKSDDEPLPDVPEHEREEFNRLCRALTQLSRGGQVRPELLNLPAEILDGVSELEAGIYEVVPIARAGGFYWFCVRDRDPALIRELSALTEEDVRGLKGDPDGIGEILVRWYGVRKGSWMPEDVEASIEEFYGLTEPDDSGRLPAPDPEAVALIPTEVAEALDTVPLKVTPEEIMLAGLNQPGFLDRQILQILVRRSISYRLVEPETFDDLFEHAYAEGPVTDPNGEGPPMDAGRWERESVEEILGAPLVLEELETPRRLLAELDEKKEHAPEVRIITDPTDARTYPGVYDEHGKLRVDQDALEKMDDTYWTPAMETFFPVFPLRDEDPELVFASSSLDRRWFLETLGLFINRPVHVLILPKSALQDLSSPGEHTDGNGQYGNGSSNGGSATNGGPSPSEDDESSDESYVHYEPPHLFDSFHELAEQNQLKKLLMLLLVYLLEHPPCRIRVESDRERCRMVQEGRTNPDELFSIESAHVYGLRYAIQELGGVSLTDFRTNQEGSFTFVFKGKRYEITFHATSVPNGQKLILQAEPAS